MKKTIAETISIRLKEHREGNSIPPYCIVLGKKTFTELCEEVNLTPVDPRTAMGPSDQRSNVMTFNGIPVVVIQHVDLFIGLGIGDLAHMMKMTGMTAVGEKH